MADEEKKEKKRKSKKKAETEAPPPPSEPPAVPSEAPPPPSEPPALPSETPHKEAKTELPPETEVPPPPSESESAPAPVEKKVIAKKKATRCGSNVFAMFTQRKVQEFKEAFQLIDQDKDGFITKSDLKLTFDLLGREVDDEDLESMLAEAPGPLNFTMFLTIFGERISGTDEEEIILSAFSMFDEGDGKMKEEVLKSTLRKRGDKFTDEEADLCLYEAPVDKEGYISIRRFTQVLTKGDDDDD